MEKNVIREYIRVRGVVQGVGFRYRTKYAAEGLGISGWVSNMWNGDVEMEVQGTKTEIQEMLRLIRKSRWITIDEIYEHEIPTESYESGFHIR